MYFKVLEENNSFDHIHFYLKSCPGDKINLSRLWLELLAVNDFISRIGSVLSSMGLSDFIVQVFRQAETSEHFVVLSVGCLVLEILRVDSF